MKEEYICKIEIIDEELININIYLDNKLKYKGNIILEKTNTNFFRL